MNYALDALWWRLSDQRVRDLASLLTAPAPWPSGQEMALPQLLGAQGLRTLLALDADPAPLHGFLAQHGSHKLGHYAEQLLAFWLTHAPHCRLIAANLPVRDGGQTLGEYDFLATVDGEPLHIELTCKCYFMNGDDPDSLTGPDQAERWRSKQQRLITQLALSDSPAGRQALPAGFALQRSLSIVRGALFYRDQPWLGEPLSGLQWNGWWRHLGEDLPVSHADSHWQLLPRLQWLSPGRGMQAVELDALRDLLAGSAAVQMVAECERRPDGAWHEIARGVVVPLAENRAEIKDRAG